MTENKEVRNFNSVIQRSADNSRRVEGIAVVFNSDSRDLGFIETIDPKAITEETINNSDIYATLDHDKSRGILARSRYGKGSLQLELREDGLHYSFDAPNAPLGDELLEYIQRGEITTSSFVFTVDPDGGEEWFYDGNGQLRRNIKKIYRLYDVSPVFEAAYEETECCKRKLEDIKNLETKLAHLRAEIEKI